MAARKSFLNITQFHYSERVEKWVRTSLKSLRRPLHCGQFGLRFMWATV